MTVDDLIGVVQWDPLTHAWDVAKAAGIEAHIDADLATRSYETIAPMREVLAKRKLVALRARRGRRRRRSREPLPRAGRKGSQLLRSPHSGVGSGRAGR